MNLANLAVKWQKRTFSYKVAYTKIFLVRPKAGHRTVALPLNTTLDNIEHSIHENVFKSTAVICVNK